MTLGPCPPIEKAAPLSCASWGDASGGGGGPRRRRERGKRRKGTSQKGEGASGARRRTPTPRGRRDTREHPDTPGSPPGRQTSRKGQGRRREPLRVAGPPETPGVDATYLESPSSGSLAARLTRRIPEGGRRGRRERFPRSSRARGPYLARRRGSRAPATLLHTSPRGTRWNRGIPASPGSGSTRRVHF